MFSRKYICFETTSFLLVNDMHSYWPGLNDKEKAELIPTLSTTDNWILPTHPQGASNKSQPPFGESQRIARADSK